MAARRPLVVASGRRKELPSADTLAIGPTATPAVLDASAMTAQRTFTLPDASGTIATTQGPGVSTPTLDTYTGAYQAFSVRKLRTAYAGSSFRVRRSSDSFEQDIGFDADGWLDVAAIASFVGASTGTVVKWYDQSGNGRDTVASSTSAFIIQTGVKQVAIQGCPGILLNTNSVMRPASSVDYFTFSGDVLAVFSVVAPYTAVKDLLAIIGHVADGGVEIRVSTSREASVLRQDQAAIINSGFSLFSDSSFSTVGYMSNGSAQELLVNGSLTTATVTPNYSPQQASDLFGAPSAGASAEYYRGIISEVILYASDQSANKYNITDDQNIAFNIVT